MTLPATEATTPMLTLIPGGRTSRRSWWESRAAMRSIVGGCPDHWWKPTARRTGACTCDRF
ncbi:MAG TPA: hypothetical protein VLA76_07405 [Candidatus Angelobacter sp.]|nr:hypothetical protein [Candidatus Angelobacter sp.]